MRSLAFAVLVVLATASTAVGAARPLSYEGVNVDPRGLVRIAGGACSGFMVTPTVFVTAAHCWAVLPLGVQVGGANASDGYDREVVDTRTPAEYSMGRSGWEWDLMVALIDEPVPADQVMTLGRSIPEPPFYGTVGGWGTVGPGGETATRPTGAVVSDWQQASPNRPGRVQDCGLFVGWGVLCQKAIFGTETCGGDSGAPFQVDGIVYGHAVAGYPGCGENLDYPGYTLDLTNDQYRNWLGKAVSDLDPTRLGAGHFSSCRIDSVEISGLNHIVFSECADGAEIIVREDGVVTTTREQYYGAFWIEIRAGNLCVQASFDGFGKLLKKDDC